MLTFVLIGYWDNLDFGFLDTQTNTALTNELLRINCLPKATYFLNRIQVREIFLVTWWHL